jgi:hypothetical protein
MSADTPASTTPDTPTAGAQPAATDAATPQRVYVEIPRLAPGQGYHAPKNYQRPMLDTLSKALIVLMCLSLPIAPAVIFVMILVFSQAIHYGLLWVWIVMIVLIEPIAALVAWGVAREALGVMGGSTFLRRSR